MEQIKPIREEIRDAAEVVGARIHEVPEETAHSIMQTAAQRFTSGVLHSFLWNELTDFAYADDPLAWTWVGEFVGGTPVFLLFDNFGERLGFWGFQFEDGSQVVPVLEECFGFEFYLTNDDVDYLICFNHHDMLYAAGSAKPWLQAKQLR